jgi:hypothetical protein
MTGFRYGVVTLFVALSSLIAAPTSVTAETNAAVPTTAVEGNCDESAQRQKKSVFFQPDSVIKTETTITLTPPCATASRTFKLCAVAQLHQERERQEYCVNEKPLRREPYYILDYYE